MVLGSTTPRIYTPPLVTGPPGPCGCGCALTPATSAGFAQERFARVVLGRPLDPWQRWTAIHAGELLPDGRPRFRRVIIIVARQNGKTELCVVLSLFWQFIEHVPLILGTSTKLDYAKESWLKAVNIAEATEALTQFRPVRRWKRDANGEQESWTTDGARYKIAAANDDAGRSLTVFRLICDELRQHRDYSTWNAAYNAMNAVSDGQAFGITNMGDDRSMVLNDLRKAAVDYIETGEGDPRLGLIEYSCPREASPLDLHALALANPNLGRRLDADTLLGQAATAMRAGGKALTGFRTEVMCIRVGNMNPAIDPARWADTLGVGDLGELRDRVAMCFDVAPDQLHATLYAAAVTPDDRVRVDVVKEWTGPDCTEQARRDLPGLLTRARPRAFGWLPTGPAASLAAVLADRKQRRAPGALRWPPRGVKVAEIRAEVTAVCMGFAQLVTSLRLERGDEPLLSGQALAAEKVTRGAGWVFDRPEDGHVDAVYAAAGAAHLAQTLPAPVGRPRIVVADDT